MDPVMDFNQLVTMPLTQMVRDAVAFIPNIVASVFIVLVGVVLAVVTRGFVVMFLKAVGFDAFAADIQLLPASDRETSVRRLPHQYAGLIAYWGVILSAVVAALNRLRLGGVAFQIEAFVNFGATVITVAILAAAGLFLSVFVGRVVEATAAKAGFRRPQALSAGAKWAMVFATAMLCLFRIGVPREVLMTVVGATYLTLCVTFVLAFGIGGTGFAASVLNKWGNDASKKP